MDYVKYELVTVIWTVNILCGYEMQKWH